MKWRTGRRSDNVEDRRGRGVGRPMAVGGGGLILIVLVMALFGKDPAELLRLLGEAQGPSSAGVDPGPLPGAGGPADEAADFVSVVLADTEDTWGRIFRASGASYRRPTLVLFTDEVESACGYASAAAGPFYCPADEKLYIDLGFYRELRERFGAPGDFAQAYVIAHEVGHHIQQLMGVSGKVHRMQQRSPDQANAFSVRLELQADCLAGIWGHHATRRDLLEEGDLDEALQAAAAIGDDSLQERSGDSVRPESFTHGSSRQRVAWLRHGLRTGSIESCDTFSQGDLPRD